MAEIKQCRSCQFWRGGNGQHTADAMRFCHFLLDTGIRRTEVDGVCMSHRKRTPRTAIKYPPRIK